MAQKRNGVLTVVAVILLLITVASFVFATINDEFSLFALSFCILEIGLCVTVFIYILNDFAKKYAICYKLFFIISLAAYMIEWAVAADVPTDAFEVVMNLCCFGAYVVLAFSTDLGRRKSLFAAYIPFVLDFILGVYYAVIYLMHPEEAGFLTFVLGYVGIVSSDLLTLIMVYGKFSDKAQRKGADADR